MAKRSSNTGAARQICHLLRSDARHKEHAVVRRCWSSSHESTIIKSKTINRYVLKFNHTHSRRNSIYTRSMKTRVTKTRLLLQRCLPAALKKNRGGRVMLMAPSRSIQCMYFQICWIQSCIQNHCVRCTRRKYLSVNS